MKYAMLLSVLLTACVTAPLSYDGYEFNNMVEAKVQADMSAAYCSDHEVTKQNVAWADKKALTLNTYLSYRKRPTYKAMEAQYKIVHAMQDRYTSSDANPSKVYCEKKWENISAGYGRMLETVGALP